MNLRQLGCIDLSSGYDPYLVHDFDFQDFDLIVEDELGYSVAESKNARWSKAKKFPWKFERIKDKKKAWANRKGFDELVKTKRFKYFGFDSALATATQKTQQKELVALLSGKAPSTPSTTQPAPPHSGTKWTKTKKFPWTFKRKRDNKPIWANKAGFDYLVKTQQYTATGFNSSLATDTQKKQQKQIVDALAKLNQSVPSTPSQPTPPHSGTKWTKTKKFPWVFKRVSDGKKLWANKAGFDYIARTGKFKFFGFNAALATAEQKTQQKKIEDTLAKLNAPKTTTPPLHHSGTKWSKTKGYPWTFKRVSDGKKIWANKAGFDYLVKTGNWQATGFDSSIANETQKSQQSSLALLLTKLPEPGTPASIGLTRMAERGISSLPVSTPSKGMAGDIQDIKRMLQLAELQREATAEHEQIEETKLFRHEVLDRLMRISNAILAPDSDLYKKVSAAYLRG